MQIFASCLFTETTELSVQVEAGANLEFTNFSIRESDFELLEDGMHQFQAAASWYYASNERGQTYKIQGRITEPLGSNWSLKSLLHPPENATEGSFGASANHGNFIELSTTVQDFVTGIPQGKIGNLQVQRLSLTSNHKGFVEKANQPFSIVIEWTLSIE